MPVDERVVDSPADLRRLVERARADPHVVAFPYRQVRELVGDEPDECHNGHGYAGGSATTPVLDSRPCRCGGHLVIRCRMCPDVQVQPPVGADCDAARTGPGRPPTSRCR